MAVIISDMEVDAASLACLKIAELIYKSPFIPVSNIRPSKKQIEFLAYDGEESLYGGAMGGGKSDAILMAALMYATVPGYSALILRRTYRQLSGDGCLIPRSKEWIGDRAVFREKMMQWTFPSGATLTFGYYDHDDDRNLYLGGAWQYCAWDEATSFKPAWYEFMFSRLRKPDWICKNCQQPLTRDNFTVQEFRHKRPGSCAAPEPVPMPTNHLGIAIPDVPIRVRSASNPGGPGHSYFKARFVVDGAPKVFVKSLLEDNPGLDKEDYKKKMANLDPVTRAQYLNGDWFVYSGNRFKKSWFREFWVEPDRNGNPVYKWDEVDTEGKTHSGWPTCSYGGVPVSMTWNMVVVDPASRSEEKHDYTAIGVFAVTPNGEILVLEIVREQMPLQDIVPRIGSLCKDYNPVFVAMEDSNFQIGIINEARRSLNVTIQRLSPEGKAKLIRATPAIIRASEGQLFVPKDEPRGKFPWLDDYLAEMIVYTGDEAMDSHDDVVDVTAYAVQCLSRHGLASPMVINPDEDVSEYNDRGTGLGIFNS